MLAAAIIVAGIAIVDSLNPATLAPALAMTLSARPGRRVFEFTAGFFAVNFAGGVLLVVGPGTWLFSLIPSAGHELKHQLYVVGGILLIGVAVALAAFRNRLTRKDPAPEEVAEPLGRRRSGSAFLVGAAIALAELPTALPYFAAVAAIDAADLSVPAEIGLVVLFNVLFLLPLIVIGIGISVFPSLQQSVIEPVRRWLSAHWPLLLAAVLGVGGVVLLAVGLNGL